MITKLTKSQIPTALGWLHDTLVLSKIISQADSKRTWEYNGVYLSTTTAADATKIWNCVLNRTLENLDSCFNSLSSYYFKPLSRNAHKITKSAEMLATYVAWFCSINGIYWDNSTLTSFEIDEFTTTLLGQALKVYDCFTVSLLPQQAPSVNTKKAATTPSAGKSSSSTTSIAPSGNVGELSASAIYSGPLSPYIRDIVSQVNNKEILSGNVFRIEGINAKAAKVIPTVFIRPLTIHGKTGSTNKVFMGSANGRTDCTVYFDNLTEANNFLTQCNNNNIIPTNITTVQVTKKLADKNGYFKVNTEFGPVYISAKKLHEALHEANSAETVQEAVEKNDFDSAEFTYNLMKGI